VAIGSAILWVGELVKIVLRARAGRAGSGPRHIAGAKPAAGLLA